MYFQIQTVHTPPEEEFEPPHLKPKPTSEHVSALVPEPRRLHDGQVRHVHVCAGHG